MSSAYGAFRSRCLQKMIAGAAIMLAGIALLFSEIRLGDLTVPGNPWLGAALVVVGALYAAAAVVALRRRKKPSVRR